ncbi:MAG: DNA gyrase inhibitor YacG [Alphaproteobacteria bacterium]
MAAERSNARISAKVVPLRKQRTCPICDKPSNREVYPFCSPRCENIDLNRWLSGAYAIPAVEEEPGADEEGVT